MSSDRIGVVLLLCAVLAGTLLDTARRTPPADGLVLAGDFHVHPFPGDGALTIWQLQREARRRGLDVIAITGHNNLAAWHLRQILGVGGSDVIVLPGQEVTAPAFHLIAVGASGLVDWRPSAREVIVAIHAQGGAAIAAHPLDGFWRPRDRATLAMLDGVEVAHPAREEGREEGDQLDRFFATARRANSNLSPVGSSDFHMTAPLGRHRTYLFVDERSASGVIRALRAGMTVAEDADGRLYGTPDLVARVPAAVRAGRAASAASTAEQACAATALLGLALLCVRRHPAVQSQDRFHRVSQD